MQKWACRSAAGNRLPAAFLLERPREHACPESFRDGDIPGELERVRENPRSPWKETANGVEAYL